MQYINALKTATLPFLFFSLLLLSPNFLCAMEPCTYATIHDAAQAGDLQVVAEQLGHYARKGKISSFINSFDRQGHTLLTRALMGRACKTDKTNKMTQLLLECKADPNQTTQGGESPLRIAVDGGDFGAVNILLEHGANTPEDVAPGLLAGIQSFVIAVQTQGYLVETQKKEIVRLEHELDYYHQLGASQGGLSNDSGLSEQEDEEQEQEEDRTQDEPARSKSPTSPAELGEDPEWELVEEQEGA